MIIFRSINSWSEIYHRSRTKEQDRTSRVAWKPKKIHAKPGGTGVKSRQRNIEEHRLKLKKYQTRQRQNQTKNKTRTGGTETKKQNRDSLTETEDLVQ